MCSLSNGDKNGNFIPLSPTKTDRKPDRRLYFAEGIGGFGICMDG